MKQKMKWRVVKYSILSYFVLILFLFMVALFPQMDEVDIALTIDVPYVIVRELEGEFGSSFPYYLATAAMDLSCDWESYKEERYIETLRTYNQRMLNDQYSYDDNFKTYFDIYQQAYGDIECFVIAKETYEKKIKKRVKVKYTDSNGKTKTKYKTEYEYEVRLRTPSYDVYDDFGAERNYKEQTRHKGNDTIAAEMTPLVSMTGGVLERVGWNEHGGYRIGVRAPSGAYFYYAHMEEYGWEIEEGDLEQGDRIKPGQLLGYVGDTGYGPEGTEGKFVNHLHLQIGVKLEDYEGDFWVNPYNAMMFREDEKKILDVYDDEDYPEIITNKEYKKWYKD